MHKKTLNLYNKIKDITSKEEFKKEISEIIKESDDLFNEETAALLFVDKLGRNTESLRKIKDIQDKKECSIIGKITKIRKKRNYTTKKGRNGKVVNLEISDDTGSINLVLWNKDVDLVENKQIKQGSTVKIINGYIKNGYNGLEINIGRYGLIEIQENKEIKLPKNNKSIKGKITKIEKTRPFFRENGDYGFVTNIKINTDKKEKNITLWDEKVKEIQDFKIGDTIEIKNIDIKNRNGKDEIHLNRNCKIKKV